MKVDAEDVIADLLARGHAVRFRATGHSMHPIIRCDEYLLVEPRSRILRGDVVLMRAERGLTAHRVIDVAGGMVTTRGDNAPGPDPTIEMARVLGVVTHAERNGNMRRIVRLSGFALRVLRLMGRLFCSLSRAQTRDLRLHRGDRNGRPRV